MAEEQDLMNEMDPFEERLLSLQKKSKTLTILLIVALATALGSAGFAFVSSQSMAAELASMRQVTEKMDSGREQAISGIDPSREVGIIHPLGTFIVNLLDPGNLRYINCRIELEVEDSATIKDITDREAVFKDAVISLIGNQSYEDVLGVEGKSRLREELLIRFNRLLPEGQVARVYLTEFVVQ
jgi:flagellar FliL protein